MGAQAPPPQLNLAHEFTNEALSSVAEAGAGTPPPEPEPGETCPTWHVDGHRDGEPAKKRVRFSLTQRRGFEPLRFKNAHLVLTFTINSATSPKQ